MIIHLKDNINAEQAAGIAEKINAFHTVSQGKNVLISGSSMKDVPNAIEAHVDQFWVFDNDIQLASREYQDEKREVKIGDVTIGGHQNATLLIGGPCSVESEDQIRDAAQLLVGMGLTTLRGGCYKPRTSPYSFQGIGFEGLDMFKEAASAEDLPIVTELLDVRHLDTFLEKGVDVIQIGTRNMQNFELLKEVGKVHVPVILKRGLSATISEWLMAAEYIASGGNHNIIFCERGIRTFETACEAWCDADQAIDPSELKILMSELTQIASILNKKI